MNFQELFLNNSTEFSLGFFVLLIWSLVWKGLALWRASERKDKLWFVILLVLNTAGVVEIIYLIVTRKKKQQTPVQKV